jgi:hypothetical protein
MTSYRAAVEICIKVRSTAAASAKAPQRFGEAFALAPLIDG